jgi:RND family efflux transporter MFP subunit
VYIKKMLSCLGIAALLAASFAANGCSPTEDTVQETQITVNVAKATKQDIAKEVSFSGMVRGKNEVYIMPKASARVTAILVHPGDRVSAGQTLITLDPTDYQAAVKQAEAALAMAEAGKKANDIQAEAARLNYERMKELHQAGAVSDQQLEAAQSQYEALTSGSVEAGVEQARAALQSAQNQLNHCNITSPITGMVGSINLSLGDMANPASYAAIVSDTSRLEIELLISESDIPFVQSGSTARVYLRAVGSAPFTGIIESVAAVADPVSKNYSVKVGLDNTDNSIKSGMFAEVVIDTARKENVLCVPSNAIVPKGGRTVVYAVDEESRAREKEVEIGIQNTHNVEIVTGITEGETIITRGNTLVNEGTLVRVVAGGEK